MRKKIKTLTATFLCMCMLAASGCGNSDDGGIGGVGRREGSGGTDQATTGSIVSIPTTEATTGDIWNTPTTQAPTTESQIPTTQAPTTENQIPTTEATTQPPQTGGVLATKKIENEYYSVTVPDGWNMEVWGAGASFCFRCTNPQDPSMVIFYAGELYPIFTNEQQKTPYYNLGDGGQVYVDAPVFADETVASLFQQWSYIVNFQIKYQGFSLFPVLNNIALQDHKVTNDAMHPINSYFTDSIGFVSATSENGTPVTSVVKASIGGAPMDLFAVGYDNSPRSIVCMYFVECPDSKADCLETLMQCVTSLQFTEKAIQESQGNFSGNTGIGGNGMSAEQSLLELDGATVPDGTLNYDLPLPDGTATMEIK